MDLHVRHARLAGSIAVPGSKSHTIRALGAALMAEGESILYSPLDSADTRSVLGALRIFGADCREETDAWRIRGRGGRLAMPSHTVDLGNSGTGLRILTALAATQNFPVAFDGDASLRTRAMKGTLNALRSLGVAVEAAAGDKCPLSVQGPFSSASGMRIKVDGVTSQFLTSLLFALPLRECDTELELDFLNEQAYVEITLGWLDFLKIRYENTSDLLHFRIPGRQSYRGFERVIPADFSTAAFPLAAAALCGDGVEIRNLDFSDLQGDKRVFDFLEQMGASLVRGDQLTVRPSAGKLHGRAFDLNGTPDALPIMAVLGALADGETRLFNVAQARLKETDRIAVMARELPKMGAVITELPDGLVIRGGSLHGAEVESYDDHRIAMSLAIAGLCADGETVVKHAESAAVTYPGFVSDFRSLGADFREI